MYIAGFMSGRGQLYACRNAQAAWQILHVSRTGDVASLNSSVQQILLIVRGTIPGRALPSAAARILGHQERRGLPLVQPHPHQGCNPAPPHAEQISYGLKHDNDA